MRRLDPGGDESLRRRRRLGGDPVEGLPQPGQPVVRRRGVDRVRREPGHRRQGTGRVRGLAGPETAPVADRGGPQLRVHRHGLRAGRPRPAVHRRRRGGQPRHDGGRPAPAPRRAVALLFRAGTGRRHRRAGDLRRLTHRADLRRHAHAHQRARPRARARALELFRAGVGGAGEHRRRRHRPLLENRAPARVRARSGRRSGRLGVARARPCRCAWPAATIEARAGG